jgi:hypothetical protein
MRSTSIALQVSASIQVCVCALPQTALIKSVARRYTSNARHPCIGGGS